jgi:hypothetical protein
MTESTIHRTDCEVERATTGTAQTPGRAREAEYFPEDVDLDDDTATLGIDAGTMGRVYGSRNEVLDEAREIKDRMRRE